MSIEALAAMTGTPLTTATPAAAPTQTPDFGKWLDQELNALNAQVGAAGESLTQLASGANGNLHRVMLDLEQTRLSFQLAVQVRNKLLESYADLMRMQI